MEDLESLYKEYHRLFGPRARAAKSDHTVSLASLLPLGINLGGFQLGMSRLWF